MMETRVFDPNQAYRYYQERYDAEQRAKELETENAELRELARSAEGSEGMNDDFATDMNVGTLPEKCCRTCDHAGITHARGFLPDDVFCYDYDNPDSRADYCCDKYNPDRVALLTQVGLLQHGLKESCAVLFELKKALRCPDGADLIECAEQTFQDARFQRAVDRIEETGILCFGLRRDSMQDAYGIEKVSRWCCELFDDQEFYGNWTYEAAEKAAEWAEAQKGAGK